METYSRPWCVSIWHVTYRRIGTQSFRKIFPNYGLLFYLLVGIVATAIMQASAATLAIVLTALNGHLITFDIGVAMVIGANVGTTITVLLGAIGGVLSKKRVALSHLIFNVLTGIIAFFSIRALVWGINLFLDVQSNSLMGLFGFASFAFFQIPRNAAIASLT